MVQATNQPAVIEITGRGSLVTNVSAHDADRRHFTVLRDIITDPAGNIRKRPGIGSPIGATLGAAITAMYEFVLLAGATETHYLIRASETTIQVRTNGAGAWVTATLPYSPTAGGLWIFATVENRCLAVNGKDPAIIFDGTSWKKAGAEGPNSAMLYQLQAPYGVGVAGCTQGDVEVTITVPANLNAATMDGKTIEINGVNYKIEAVTTGGGGGVPQVLDLTEKFKELSDAALPYKIFDGPCDWDIPPVYAYGYENQTTGHCTNIRHSSVTTENTTRIAETSQVGRYITLTNIVYDPTLFAQGFTKIRLFRTPRNGNLLRALATLLDNSATPGTTSFAEIAATWSDTQLMNFPAPRTELSVPPSPMRAVAYRMGRACGIKESRFHFSMHDVELTNKLGTFAESWPPGQSRLLRSQPRGLLTVGTNTTDEALIVQTSAGDYIVSGFDQDDFDVTIMPTWRSGSFQYGGIDSGGELLSFYADRQLLAYPSSDNYGFPIQKKLDLIPDVGIQHVRLHRFAAAGSDLLLVSARRTSGSTTNDVTYVYDFNGKSWSEWNVGFTAFATAQNLSTGAPELWASTGAGKTFQLLQAGIWQDEGVDYAPIYTSVILRPFAQFGFSEDLLTMHLFTSNASFAWTGELLIHEQGAGAGIATPYVVVPDDAQTAQGRQLHWTPTDSDRVHASAFQVSVAFPSANSDFWIEKHALLFTAGQTSAAAA